MFGSLNKAPNGQWRKVIDGRSYYFGSIKKDPTGEAAWMLYQDFLHDRASLTVDQLVVRYLEARSRDVQNRLLSTASFQDYMINLPQFANAVGSNMLTSNLGPAEFTAYRSTLDASGKSLHYIRRILANIRSMFRYAADQQWIPPVSFGRGLVAPSIDPDTVDMWYARHGKVNRSERLLKRREVRKLLSRVRQDVWWHALVLVMLNTAMNPTEIARLAWAEIDMVTGRLSRRRGKTRVRQECYLWRITRKALAGLPRVNDRIFIKQNGGLLVSVEPRFDKTGKVVHVYRTNRLSRPFREQCEKAGLPGITPYTLRRSVRTAAEHAGDNGAARRMMGHALEGMDRTYVRGPFPMWRLKRLSRTIYWRLLVAKPSSRPAGASGRGVEPTEDSPPAAPPADHPS